MDKHLIITMLGSHDPSLINEICRTVADCNCSITDSRIQVLGSEIAAMISLSGNWGAIAKIENSLTQLKKHYDIHIQIRRTESPKSVGTGLPFSIQVVGQDRSRVIHKITEFFIQQDIGIFELEAQTYVPNNTETVMFILTMNVLVGLDIDISELRENFLVLCDDLNLDSLIEPEKPFFI